MKRRALTTLLACGGVLSPLVSVAATPARRARRPASAAASQAMSYAGHPAVQRLADELAERRGWEPAWTLAQLEPARRLPSVQRLVMPPPAGTAKNWAAYRARFVEPQRIDAGLRFWARHAEALELAETRFGVPPAIVLGILGVETFYGRILGDFRLLDALATLAFDFPTGRRDRSAFFRDELEELLVLARREGRSAASMKGSYAGAWGLPQFMPSSVNRYAVDFDGDGHIDLLGSPADAIGSVAHYLQAFGWEPGLATHHAIALPSDTATRARLLAPDIVPSFTAAELTAAGAELSPSGQAHVGLLAVVELQNGAAAPSYVAGTANFYTVTRYNWSSYYAMAVIDLADALQRARSSGPPGGR